MLAKLYSFGLSGLEAYPITVEVHVSKGLPATHIVGLPDSAIRESKERIRSAIKNSGYKYPNNRITINLSPADIKKEGPSYDLAMALGILIASEQIMTPDAHKYLYLGELSLDGQVQSVNGALAVALSITSNKWQGLIVPQANAQESSIAQTIAIYGLQSLNDVIHFLSSEEKIESHQYTVSEGNEYTYDLDFADVKGQTLVKRGMEIAAAGGHNVLLIGPPGSGKTMLSRRMMSILPEMTRQESLETTKIYSVLGLMNGQNRLMDQRPFRSPHHTASSVALIGGSSNPKPGEVTLAHNGVLFLDELPEFNRSALETLRQPLEEGFVTIARAQKTVRFPANFLLVTAMNPSPSGYAQTDGICSTREMERYMNKLSGPLLDRIDLHLNVEPVKASELLNHEASESSSNIKKRTVAARKIQLKRFGDDGIVCNAQMSAKHMKQYCILNKDCQNLLKENIEHIGLSARAYDKVLKVARTIADLAKQEHINTEHLAEAIQYRSLDHKWQ